MKDNFDRATRRAQTLHEITSERDQLRAELDASRKVMEASNGSAE